MFLQGIGCPREAPRCPEKRTGVKNMQSSGYGLMETAAEALRFCSAIQGLTLRQVLMLNVPLATQGFSLRWLLLLLNTGSRRAGFSGCDTRAQ